MAAIIACETADSYVYTARRYDPIGACLEPYKAVEVVDGPGAAATCPESCLVVGTEVFVTTMCPPLPTIATELEADAADCIAARAVASMTCGEDGDVAAEEDTGSANDASSSDGSAPAPDLDATVPAPRDAADGG
jgi:hypothetical protein